VPNVPKTPHRQVRIDDDTWDELGDVARARGTDRSALIRDLIAWFLRRPNARPPKRAEAAELGE
jgi:predicted transcriptional regulator